HVRKSLTHLIREEQEAEKQLLQKKAFVVSEDAPRKKAGVRDEWGLEALRCSLS
ncbi:hypothetical protein K0M31_006958, partial [Melipona bicolor]